MTKETLARIAELWGPRRNEDARKGTGKDKEESKTGKGQGPPSSGNSNGGTGKQDK